MLVLSGEEMPVSLLIHTSLAAADTGFQVFLLVGERLQDSTKR